MASYAATWCYMKYVTLKKPKWNLTTNETSVELSGLMIFTSYVVRVRAFTRAGDGPYSDGVVRKTLESCKYLILIPFYWVLERCPY